MKHQLRPVEKTACWCHFLIHFNKGGAERVMMKACGGARDLLFEFQTDNPRLLSILDYRSMKHEEVPEKNAQ